MTGPGDGLDVGDERQEEVKNDTAVSGVYSWRY